MIKKRTLLLACAGLFFCANIQTAYAQRAPEIWIEKSAEGRDITIYRFGTGEKEYLFLFGTFHGDESQGEYMLKQLIKLLEQKPAYYLEKSIFVIPVVNPDGLAHKSRVNAHQVDLNRNFPTQNFKPNAHQHTRYYAGPKALSEPESQIIHNLLAPYLTLNRVKIMSIHAPLAVNNYDGPAESLAKFLSLQNSYPVSADIGYPTPGSFGSYYGKELKYPVITLETGPVSQEKAWLKHQKALLAFIQFPNTDLNPVLPKPREPHKKPEPTQRGTQKPTKPQIKLWWPLKKAEQMEENKLWFD